MLVTRKVFALVLLCSCHSPFFQACRLLSFIWRAIYMYVCVLYVRACIYICVCVRHMPLHTSFLLCLSVGQQRPLHRIGYSHYFTVIFFTSWPSNVSLRMPSASALAKCPCASRLPPNDQSSSPGLRAAGLRSRASEESLPAHYVHLR